MATDARFDKIKKIVPCKNSDNLETVIVSNFPCVVRKGEFKEGERAAERYTRVMLAKERRNANSRTYNTTYNTRYNSKKKKGRY